MEQLFDFDKSLLASFATGHPPLLLSIHVYFFPIGQKYKLRVFAKDRGSPPLTSDSVTVRIDVIEAEEVMVKLELGISLEEFEANRELFKAKLSERLGADVRIADVTVVEEEARRKRREAKRR